MLQLKNGSNSKKIKFQSAKSKCQGNVSISEIKMAGQCRKAVLDSLKTSDILLINLKSKSSFEGLKPFSSFRTIPCAPLP